MFLSNWATITPELVSQQMSFVEGDYSWRYQADQNGTMAAKQAEGVAYLCRLLQKHRLALLADEVGMGKTFQAIGIIRLLQQRKPDAKVLVIGPNKTICKQWVKEFGSFDKDHWCDKSSAPVKVADPESKLADMISRVGEGQHHVYFTTIHALSGLTKESESSDKAGLARKQALELKQRVMSYLDQQGFDLLVIDEAHYLRARDGGSQKVAAAQAFFGEGEGEQSLAKRVLLMTATPTHSSVNDVANILRYFASEEELKESTTQAAFDAAQLLQRYGLRRLRLLQGHNGAHYAKQHYRKEIAHPVSFAENQNAELFFGLYQRQLVKQFQAKASNRQFLYGYLEGFESFGEHDQETAKHEVEQPNSEHSKDAFSKAPDTELLHGLSQEYYRCFNQFPEHPKYKALVDSFVPTTLEHSNLDEIKHLVFVRRIPSVRELTKRVNTRYDNVLGLQIANALNLTQAEQQAWQQSHWSRVWLNGFFNHAEEREELVAEDDEEANELSVDDNQLRSRITELFVVKKRDPNALAETRNTECTNVGLRFRKPDSIFSLYLEPALDYEREAYGYHFEHQTGDRKRATYSTAAQFQRAQRHRLECIMLDEEKPVAEYLPTIWSHLFELLTDQEQAKFRQWSEATKENFANYFKAGVLFASPVMVELFCWFYRFDNDPKLHNSGEGAHARYLDFIQYTAPKLSQSLLLWYFKSALETFEDVCKKIAGAELDDYTNEWRALKGQTSPAAFASGETSNREGLQLSFNSPFYPNVLVATSVFQEGVNLHLQCNQVHHYGIAGSPGDHEQRVGRLDRLFSKVNRQYQKGQQGELKISFPYLEHSFDEDQLASFLERKTRAESKLDKCLLDNHDAHVGSAKAQQWQRYLKQPELSQELDVVDPYPASF
ncbi:DEAD/DEAH box helicase [Vibrio agarivorans]|uniref:DEAD/DEAH box helicase n=1 Tax=Vibrio agarivorans TaxID=153622 RepID=A0ABT7Y5Y4_9VIBR|nr:DEAD/DEAH box helicase [Vibrio agarivorans]MDN2483464.1 DEAD/DEAH box helicase [Vibrio agarivorans]